MTSKEYRGKTCAYCRVPEISVEGDHVVARQFFLVQDRGNLPKFRPAVSAMTKSRLWSIMFFQSYRSAVVTSTLPGMVKSICARG